ncbi:MAG TPA: hypothetical protein EYQ63_03115, partial [Fuerstia sp.]|nr:hypothetical protein [Fuerstiella sp.]
MNPHTQNCVFVSQSNDAAADGHCWIGDGRTKVRARRDGRNYEIVAGNCSQCVCFCCGPQHLTVEQIQPAVNGQVRVAVVVSGVHVDHVDSRVVVHGCDHQRRERIFQSTRSVTGSCCTGGVRVNVDHVECPALGRVEQGFSGIDHVHVGVNTIAAIHRI